MFANSEYPIRRRFDWPVLASAQRFDPQIESRKNVLNHGACIARENAHRESSAATLDEDFSRSLAQLGVMGGLPFVTMQDFEGTRAIVALERFNGFENRSLHPDLIANRVKVQVRKCQRSIEIKNNYGVAIQDSRSFELTTPLNRVQMSDRIDHRYSRNKRPENRIAGRA